MPRSRVRKGRGSGPQQRDALLTAQELAVLMDVAGDPWGRHWTDARGDETWTQQRDKLAQSAGRKTGYEVAQPITRWRTWLLTQTQFATVAHVSERHVQNLVERGLPVEGERTSWRTPWPDCWAWLNAYQRANAFRESFARRSDAVEFISSDRARLEHLETITREWRKAEECES